jgi:hypothetical protein
MACRKFLFVTSFDYQSSRLQSHLHNCGLCFVCIEKMWRQRYEKLQFVKEVATWLSGGHYSQRLQLIPYANSAFPALCKQVPHSQLSRCLLNSGRNEILAASLRPRHVITSKSQKLYLPQIPVFSLFSAEPTPPPNICNTQKEFLISSFRRVVNSACNLLGLFPGVWCLIADVSEHCLFHLHKQVDIHSPMKM